MGIDCGRCRYGNEVDECVITVVETLDGTV